MCFWPEVVLHCIVSHVSSVILNWFGRSNPLGHGGTLADEFSFLMKAMWSHQYRFISPRDFKVWEGLHFNNTLDAAVTESM